MSQIDPKLIQEKRRIEQDLSNSFIQEDIGAIHSIYFDLNLLQDVYLGALYLHTKDEDEYNKVLSVLPYYQSRIDKDVSKYFPFMENINDEFLFNFIRNTHRQDLLYKASPHTNLWFFIPKLIDTLVNRNRVVDGYDGFHCDIYINLYPTNYTADVCKTINKYLKNISKHISFKTVNMPFEELPVYIRNLPDVYFFEDISTVASTDSKINKDFYQDMSYDRKYIFSKKLITADNLKTDIITSLTKTKNFLNIFTQFDFIDIYFPGVEYIPSVDINSDKNSTVIHRTD